MRVDFDSIPYKSSVNFQRIVDFAAFLKHMAFFCLEKIFHKNLIKSKEVFAKTEI